ncbi:hypothetical protein ACTI_68340 [Actinoplanes sp. OR16]|nr:hypothetical protein ACTI_68340 [Actinoplanes sp. OR16]
MLITGTVGSGKTTVAEALGDQLAERRVPHAVIDVDWLRRGWPSPPGDPFNAAMTLRNLRAVARNFLEAGADRLILAGVIESRAERDAYREAVGVPLTVCRLQVDLALVRRRLTRRHENDPAGLGWHLRRSGELDGILRTAAVEDVVVDAGELPVSAVAAEVGRHL